MRTKKQFVKRLEEDGRFILGSRYENVVEKIHRAKEFTGFLDYRACGVCSKDLGRKCCGVCNYSHGYLVREWNVITKAPEYYVKLWDENTGFWRKDKGCILERKYRSSVCLAEYCLSDEPSVEDLRDKEYGRILYDLMYRYSKIAKYWKNIVKEGGDVI